MKTKLKIIIPIIAVICIALAFIFIRFRPAEKADINAVLITAQQYLTEQKYEQAAAEFEKAIQIDPRNVDAYIGIAQAYELIGDTEKALEWLHKGYDLTGDPALKAEIDRLSGSAEAEVTSEQTIEETVESTTTPTEEETTTTETVESDTTLTEEETTITETVDSNTTTTEVETTVAETVEKYTDEEIAEEIKAKALSVIETFDVYKGTAQPNSVVYYYLPSSKRNNPLTKCIYDDEGNLTLTYEQLYDGDIQSCSGEISLLNWKNNSTEFYRYYSRRSGSVNSVWERLCYSKCFVDNVYSGSAVASTGLEQSDFKCVTDRCYVFEDQFNPRTINIYVDGDNELMDITVEDEWSVTKFTQKNDNWVGNYSMISSDYSYGFYPCENTLPAGVSEDDFTIPDKDTDDCKIFYNWDEYAIYQPYS